MLDRQRAASRGAAVLSFIRYCKSYPAILVTSIDSPRQLNFKILYFLN